MIHIISGKSIFAQTLEGDKPAILVRWAADDGTYGTATADSMFKADIEKATVITHAQNKANSLSRF